MYAEFLLFDIFAVLFFFWSRQEAGSISFSYTIWSCFRRVFFLLFLFLVKTGREECFEEVDLF